MMRMSGRDPRRPVTPAAAVSADQSPQPEPVGRAMPVHIRGLTIQDYYSELPSQAILTLASLFGARFLCLQDRSGRLFYIPNITGGVDAVAQRLGLYL